MIEAVLISNSPSSVFGTPKQLEDKVQKELTDNEEGVKLVSLAKTLSDNDIKLTLKGYTPTNLHTMAHMYSLQMRAGGAPTPEA